MIPTEIEENLISLRRWGLTILGIGCAFCIEIWMDAPRGMRVVAPVLAQLIMFMVGVWMGTNYGRRVEKHAASEEPEDGSE